MKKKNIFIFVLLLNTFVYSQEYSNKIVIKNDDSFLPFIKGKMVDRVSQKDILAQKALTILKSHSSVNKPQGYEVEAYSDININYLSIYFIPYILIEDKPKRANAGNELTLYFNKITSFLGLPLVSDSIYIEPLKVAEFMGYPVYEQNGYEVTLIHKTNVPLFLPVSCEEYLTTLINKEMEQKKMNDDVPKIQNEKEIEKTYLELLTVNRTIAEEYKMYAKKAYQELTTYISDNKRYSLVASLKKELDQLSLVNRKRQAYYSNLAIGKEDFFSGLDLENLAGDARALVKPNYQVRLDDTERIHLIVLKWKMAFIPRLYIPQKTFGYELVDDRMYELYQSQSVWKQIIELVR